MSSAREIDSIHGKDRSQSRAQDKESKRKTIASACSRLTDADAAPVDCRHCSKLAVLYKGSLQYDIRTGERNPQFKQYRNVKGSCFQQI